MYLGNIVNFISLRPGLIPIVPLHHARGDDACNADKECHDERDQSEDSMWAKLLFPIDIGIYLHAGAHSDSCHYQTDYIVAVMHQIPWSLEISLRRNKCIA